MAETDLPTLLRLAPGEERHYRLPGHGTGGYRWHSRVEGESVRASVDYEDEPVSPELDDDAAAGPAAAHTLAQVVAIVAVRTGDSAVLLQERRSWEAQAAATRRIDVQVRQSPAQATTRTGNHTHTLGSTHA